MNTILKVGGYASLVTGVLFVAILVIQFGLLAPLGVTGPGTPADTVLAAAKTTTAPFLILNLITVLFSVTLVLGAVAVRERLHGNAQNRMRLAIISTSVGSALFLASGIISYMSFSRIVAAGDGNAFMLMDAVVNGLVNSGIFAFGWTAVLWGSAGLSTKGLPAVLSYVLIVAGVIAILSFVIPIFGLLGVFINIIWAFWLGLVLLRPAPMMGSMEMDIR